MAKSFAKTLGKILGKFCEFKMSPKPQNYYYCHCIGLGCKYITRAETGE